MSPIIVLAATFENSRACATAFRRTPYRAWDWESFATPRVVRVRRRDRTGSGTPAATTVRGIERLNSDRDRAVIELRLFGEWFEPKATAEAVNRSPVATLLALHFFSFQSSSQLTHQPGVSLPPRLSAGQWYLPLSRQKPSFLSCFQGSSNLLTRTSSPDPGGPDASAPYPSR